MSDETPRTGGSEQGSDDAGQRAQTPQFANEPMAGEGADDDEATISQGPALGGASGIAGQGTTEEGGSSTP